MVDYHKLRTNDWKLPEPEPEPEEEQADPEPLIVEIVYNELEEQRGTTIALKISCSVPRHRPGAPTADR